MDFFKNFRIGDYPAEYNRKIHGPYDPAVYYGKRDTPFGEVKMGELGKWFARRNYSPRAFMGVLSRAHWRWQHKYVFPKYGGIAAYAQAYAILGVIFYILNYDKIGPHKNYKYH